MNSIQFNTPTLREARSLDVMKVVAGGKSKCFFVSRCYITKLPFLLIFGVATTIDVIHRSLPHGTTSKLAIQSFAAAPSIHLLAKFAESLVMDTQVPFRLGGKVLKSLLETFSFHDLSVRHFLMSLKCCLLEHLRMNDFAVLCCHASQREEAMKHFNCKMMTEEQLAKSKTKGFDLKQELAEMDEKTELFNIFVSALHAIVANLPRSPLGKNVSVCKIRQICSACSKAFVFAVSPCLQFGHERVYNSKPRISRGFSVPQNV